MSARADLIVEVTGIKTNNGTIRALLFVKADGFPEDRTKALAELSVPASQMRNDVLRLVFKNISSETGVISVFHDLDNSGSLKKKLAGNAQGTHRHQQLEWQIRAQL